MRSHAAAFAGLAPPTRQAILRSLQFTLKHHEVPPALGLSGLVAGFVSLGRWLAAD